MNSLSSAYKISVANRIIYYCVSELITTASLSSFNVLPPNMHFKNQSPHFGWLIHISLSLFPAPLQLGPWSLLSLCCRRRRRRRDACAPTVPHVQNTVAGRRSIAALLQAVSPCNRRGEVAFCAVTLSVIFRHECKCAIFF